MKLKILLFLLIAAYAPVFGQVNAQKCDYTILYDQGKKAENDSLFDKALLCFNSARRCDPSKGKEIDEAINKVFAGIQKQKKTAITERKRAEIEKTRAEEQTIIAIEQKNRAEKQARAANNLAKAVIAKEKNPTLAFRMLEYGTQRYPDDKATTFNFYKMAMDTAKQFPFFQKILRGAK